MRTSRSIRKGVQATARYEEAEVQRPTVDIPLSQIAISLQDHQAFLNTDQDIADLAAKEDGYILIKAEGLIQPVVLEADGQGQFRVIAGHMRVEACKRLGWRSVPAIIREPA